MNLIKKFAFGVCAVGLASSFVACSDSEGGASFGEITISEKSAGVWSVDGLVTAEEDLFDIRYNLAVNGDTVTGAILSYEVKDLKDSGAVITQLKLGENEGDIKGLGTEIYLSAIESNPCDGKDSVEFTLSAVAYAASSGVLSSGDTAKVNSAEYTFKVACPSSVTDIPGVDEPVLSAADSAALAAVDASAALETVGSYDLGGKVATLGSSLDLDAGKVYVAANVTGDVLNAVDVIFSGTAIMTPYGTSENGYMSKKYATSENTSLIYTVDATAGAAAKTLEDLSALMVEKNMVNSSTITKDGQYFLVVTDKLDLFLISTSGFDSAKQLVTIKAVSDK
jgi:hypothetical protein